MDKYEKLLEEKIENAECDLVNLNEHWGEYEDYSERHDRLDSQIDAYRDALATYRNLKAKGEI